MKMNDEKWEVCIHRDYTCRDPEHECGYDAAFVKIGGGDLIFIGSEIFGWGSNSSNVVRFSEIKKIAKTIVTSVNAHNAHLEELK